MLIYLIITCYYHISIIFKLPYVPNYKSVSYNLLLNFI